MATGFSTRSGPDGYRLNFDTDNLDYYLLMQKIARHCVDGKPAADVVEVRHGRWKNGGNGLYDTCTACGKEIYLAIPMNYCPECGALMEKKEDEHD